MQNSPRHPYRRVQALIVVEMLAIPCLSGAVGKRELRRIGCSFYTLSVNCVHYRLNCLWRIPGALLVLLLLLMLLLLLFGVESSRVREGLQRRQPAPCPAAARTAVPFCPSGSCTPGPRRTRMIHCIHLFGRITAHLWFSPALDVGVPAAVCSLFCVTWPVGVGVWCTPWWGLCDRICGGFV